MPEFMIIAVVALVVIGPERLPEVMRRLGKTYFQLRKMSDELIAQFRAQIEEITPVMKEFQATMAGAMEEGTLAERSESDGPRPAVYQVPPASLAPNTAPDAGPWVLPAWKRDNEDEIEPIAADYPVALTALPRLALATDDYLVDDWSDAGGPSLMGPAPDESETLPFPFDELEVAGPSAPAVNGTHGSDVPASGSRGGTSQIAAASGSAANGYGGSHQAVSAESSSTVPTHSARSGL